MEFEKLKQIVAEILSVDPRELTEETNFIDDLCADSLDLYQVIEETFEIAIPEEEAEKIKTVGEAVELIRKTRNE
jgi:acyl carrier protein